MRIVERGIGRIVVCLAVGLTVQPVLAHRSAPKAPPMVGTGFFIDNGILLTAAHNIKACRYLDIGSDQVGKIAVSIVKTDRESDLALLRARGAGLPTPLSLANRDAEDQSAASFTVFGFPGDNPTDHAVKADTRLLNGDVRVGKPANPADVLWLQSDAVMAGWSGGPVLDHSGHVTGMVVALSLSRKDSEAVIDQPPSGVFIASGAEPMREIMRRAGLDVATPRIPEFAGMDPSLAVVRVFCWR